MKYVYFNSEMKIQELLLKARYHTAYIDYMDTAVRCARKKPFNLIAPSFLLHCIYYIYHIVNWTFK